MIKLFRQIRQNLIMESPAPPKASVSKVTTARTTRYLTYAIGEIILVVIGILIALQINNWNTSRQLKTLNQEFLIKMLAELDQNKDRLENDVIRGAYGWPGLIKATKACDSLLRLSYIGLEQKDLPYVLTAHIDAGGTALALNTSTHEELLNTGKLYSLGSDSLVTAITNYYKLYERESYYQNDNATSSDVAYKSLQKGFLKLRLDYEMGSESFNINHYPYYFDRDSERYQELQSDLYVMKFMQDLNLGKARKLVTATDYLMKIISNEIARI